ncbi:hypothetical protein BDW62DRAFT_207119 [Aspergillus aurantiobrunneus]
MSAFSAVDLSQYTVAWICNREIEFKAAVSALDEVHVDYIGPCAPGHYPEGWLVYAFGEIQGNNVVIVSAQRYKPNGVIASMDIQQTIRDFFPRVRVSMMVTTGGGVPRDKHDVRLGDVVVSKFANPLTVVNVEDVDMEDNRSKITPQAMSPPSRWAERARCSFEQDIKQKRDNVSAHLANIVQKNPECVFPSTADDLLFESADEHQGKYGQGCEQCDAGKAIQRPVRDDTSPRVHFGPVASGAAIGRAMDYRDALTNDTGAIAVQIGAIPLMEFLRPLLVVGVANYADYHANEEWENYAAAAAAACAKAIVEGMP